MQHSSFAPGRVELLGNHTDYNEGLVLSAAIDRGISMQGEASGSFHVELCDAHLQLSHTADAASLAPIRDAEGREREWANYPLGVLAVFRQAGFPVSGFRARFSSDLPLGAGLSSSAALEVATAKLLAKIFSLSLSPLEMAKLCRRAENEFVGVNCGLLDQASSVFGKAGHAIYLDCRAETVENRPFPAGVELLITQCGVPHRLTGGEYNERRAQCFDAAKRLNARALRDVTPAQLEAARGTLPTLSYRRAAHVVGENERVLHGAELLQRGAVAEFGALMFQSHESSRLHFENSTPELDTLVEIARAQPGVLGSRLTGGGFGGATVTLVESAHAEAAAAALRQQYHQRTGNAATTLICKISDGAH